MTMMAMKTTKTTTTVLMRRMTVTPRKALTFCPQTIPPKMYYRFHSTNSTTAIATTTKTTTAKATTVSTTPSTAFSSHDISLKLKQVADDLETEYQSALAHYNSLKLSSTSSTTTVSSTSTTVSSTTPSSTIMIQALERLRIVYEQLQWYPQALDMEYERLTHLDTTNFNDMAQHFYIVGTIYSAHNKLIEATKQLKQAIALRSTLYPSTFSHVVGNDLVQLAKVYCAREDTSEAMALLDQAEMHYRHDGQPFHSIMTDVTRGMYSDTTSSSSSSYHHHADLTSVLEHQAVVARKMDQHSLSGDKFQEAIDTIVDPSDTDRTHLLQLGLAQALTAMGSTDQALKLYQSMMESLELKDSDANPMLASLLHGAIGELHYLEGDYAEAMTELRTGLLMSKQYGGETHPETGNLFNLMGACQGKLGQWSEAAGYFKQALFIARLKAQGDATHPEVQSIVANLNMVEQALARPSWPGQSSS